MVHSQRRTITLLHFSDYHGQATPFYTEGQSNVAGLARAIAYLRPYAEDPNTLIFNGGDVMSLGHPSWSDKYYYADWTMFNDIVDAMALGNHDAAYGPEIFTQCRESIKYPIVSANTCNSDDQPLFLHNGKNYVVFEIENIRIGVFGLAGSDFDRLIPLQHRPTPNTHFANRVEMAQHIVSTLQTQERVHVIVLIGHSSQADDIALAQTVPGIDIIFGSHSHIKEELYRIPETQTYMISPFQYLMYISKLELTLIDEQLSQIEGGLIPMSPDLPEDVHVASEVARMQQNFAQDRRFTMLFEPLGRATKELTLNHIMTGESLLGNFVTDIVRATSHAHIALMTANSFRAPLPPGIIREQHLQAALPYDNQILCYTLRGEQILTLLNYSISCRGSDMFSQLSGVRITIEQQRLVSVQITANPTDTTAGYETLIPTKEYKMAVADFQAQIVNGYRDIFADAAYSVTQRDLRNEVRLYIQNAAAITATLDGRIQTV
ncbi:MAG: 5'-nucleotidase C-terminal domain-containing protein [Chloroflexota bacterium]